MCPPDLDVRLRNMGVMDCSKKDGEKNAGNTTTGKKDNDWIRQKAKVIDIAEGWQGKNGNGLAI